MLLERCNIWLPVSDKHFPNDKNLLLFVDETLEQGLQDRTDSVYSLYTLQ